MAHRKCNKRTPVEQSSELFLNYRQWEASQKNADAFNLFSHPSHIVVETFVSKRETSIHASRIRHDCHAWYHCARRLRRRRHDYALRSIAFDTTRTIIAAEFIAYDTAHNTAHNAAHDTTDNSANNGAARERATH